MKSNLEADIDALSRFTGSSLTRKLSYVESAVRGVAPDRCSDLLRDFGAVANALAAAAEIKRQAGQINVTIHALGILLCLPHILEPEERIEYVSLGAGNTGRKYDLATNLRISEFKFIKWQGGSETIRQNSIFKDFVQLEENPTSKRKYLYLMGTQHAIRFFESGRVLESVLSRNEKLRTSFFGRFGNRFKTVRDYYQVHHAGVKIEDVSGWLPELSAIGQAINSAAQVPAKQKS